MSSNGYPQATIYLSRPVLAALERLEAQQPGQSRTKVIQYAILRAAEAVEVPQQVS